MRPWVRLDARQQSAFRATIAFLSGRLQERATIEWALTLRKDDLVPRTALDELIDGAEGRKLIEPWRSAWRLIQESWRTLQEVSYDSEVAPYHLRERINSGDRSGDLVNEIVQTVAPRPKLERHSTTFPISPAPSKPTAPHRVSDLFSVAITSGHVIDPDILGTK